MLAYPLTSEFDVVEAPGSEPQSFVHEIVETPFDEDREILAFYFRRKKFVSQYGERLRARNPLCTYCKRPVTREHASVDHLIPRCQGGLNTPANLVLCCKFCNQSKGPRTIQEWAADLAEVAKRLGRAVSQPEGGVA